MAVFPTCWPDELYSNCCSSALGAENVLMRMHADVLLHRLWRDGPEKSELMIYRALAQWRLLLSLHIKS